MGEKPSGASAFTEAGMPIRGVRNDALQEGPLQLFAGSWLRRPWCVNPLEPRRAAHGDERWRFAAQEVPILRTKNP